MEFESKIIEFIQAGMSQEWTIFFRIISLLGSWVGFLIAFVIFFYFSRRYAVIFGITYGIGVGFNYLFKLIVMRPRPYITYESIQMLTDAIGNSFPSGHAVSSTIIAFFVIMFVYRKCKDKFIKYGTILSMLIFVGIVCLARMYLGVHYLTDVIAGICLGLLICLVYYLINRKIVALIKSMKV